MVVLRQDDQPLVRSGNNPSNCFHNLSSITILAIVIPELRIQKITSVQNFNDIVYPDGKVARSVPYITDHHVIQHANYAIAQARAAGQLIAHVKVGFSPSYVECLRQSPVFGRAHEFGALQLGTWGTEFYEDFVINPTDKVIVKHRVSALYNTELATVLRANQIELLRMWCGVATNMAVKTITR